MRTMEEQQLTAGKFKVQSFASLLFLYMRCYDIDIYACVDSYVQQSLCSGQCVPWAVRFNSVNHHLA